MKEESKYYTPTMEEFHVGFEHEILYNDKFESLTVTEWPDFEDIRYALNLDKVRVKYLDREDIESLGFANLGCLWFERKEYDCRIRMWKNTELDIYKDWNINMPESCLVFRGKIKNKSELQQILKMVL